MEHSTTKPNLLTLNQAIDLVKSGNLDDLAKLPMAQVIDVATEYREIIRAEEKEVKNKKEIFGIMEKIILQLMYDAGTEESPMITAGGLHSTATVSEMDVPSATDWESFYEYVKETDGFHLIQKRLSAKAVTEEQALGDKIPGIEMFKQRKLSLRVRS